MASPARDVSKDTRKWPKIYHLKNPVTIQGAYDKIFYCCRFVLFLSFLSPNLEGSESKASNMIEGKLEVDNNNKKASFLIKLEETLT